MSARFKLLLIVVFSIFATAATGIYITQRQPWAAVSKTSNGQPQHFLKASQEDTISRVRLAPRANANPERANYQEIPLENINSSLQGSNPTNLALDAFEGNFASHKEPKKVEVSYPQPNRVLVIITQTQRDKKLSRIARYRVELTTFGRSLFVSSPPIWQIIWAGSQECFANISQKNCQG
ncbi:hypothetical protein [Scytonema sp. NUACC26]|uniref:hypothetical protein n=1 Tax=Scytonema sp. NUACC26 TaxID=3140176 RepID=UPI0034DBE28C